MMFKTLAALVFALSCSATDVQAQTHPCDAPAVTVIQTNTGFGLGFCHNGKDNDGNPVIVTSFRLQVDGADVFTGALAPIGTPNALGSNYYETPKTLMFSRGQHTAVLFVSSIDGEGPASDPFVFTRNGLPPGKGLIKKVVK